MSLGYQDKEFDITAMASAWTPSTTMTIWDVSITLSGHVGSIGGKFNVGNSKFDVGMAYGLGLSLSINW